MLQNGDNHVTIYWADSVLDSLNAGEHRPPSPLAPPSCGSDVFISSVLGALAPPGPTSPSGACLWDPEVRVPVLSRHFFAQTPHTRILPPTPILFKQQVVPFTFGKPFLGSILNCSQENMSPEPPTFPVGTGVYRFDFMLS